MPDTTLEQTAVSLFLCSYNVQPPIIKVSSQVTQVKKPSSVKECYLSKCLTYEKTGLILT